MAIVPPEVAIKFHNSLVHHITSVRVAGIELGVTEERLAVHDNSKWSSDEFPGYALYYCGNCEDGRYWDKDLYFYSWLHHIHHNDHHWQHWVFPDEYNPKDASLVVDSCLYMPEEAALEMIADWMGASFAYTNSWDMTEWLEKHWKRIKLHPDTREYIRKELKNLGYHL